MVGRSWAGSIVRLTVRTSTNRASGRMFSHAAVPSKSKIARFHHSQRASDVTDDGSIGSVVVVVVVEHLGIPYFVVQRGFRVDYALVLIVDA